MSFSGWYFDHNCSAKVNLTDMTMPAHNMIVYAGWEADWYLIEIDPNGAVEGEIYGAMPTGMESTIKVRVGEFLLTGVVFGSTLFKIGEKIRFNIDGDKIMLFDRKGGKCISLGRLDF
jgi:hypothetical protein